MNMFTKKKNRHNRKHRTQISVKEPQQSPSASLKPPPGFSHPQECSIRCFPNNGVHLLNNGVHFPIYGDPRDDPVLMGGIRKLCGI